MDWKLVLTKGFWPVKFTVAFTLFLSSLLYICGASILQGLGMLGMYLTMPSFMRIVYPTPIGKVHTTFLSLYRMCFINEEGHSRSIRIDLSASTGAGRGRESEDGYLPAAAREGDSGGMGGSGGTGSGGGLAYSVHTVACLTDNYSYIIVDRSGPAGQPRAVALVDPCEPEAVLRALARI
jgi:uncharacterized membrane protein YgcG